MISSFLQIQSPPSLFQIWSLCSFKSNTFLPSNRISIFPPSFLFNIFLPSNLISIILPSYSISAFRQMISPFLQMRSLPVLFQIWSFHSFKSNTLIPSSESDHILPSFLSDLFLLSFLHSFNYDLFFPSFRSDLYLDCFLPSNLTLPSFLPSFIEIWSFLPSCLKSDWLSNTRCFSFLPSLFLFSDPFYDDSVWCWYFI